ncbi:Regulatory activator SdiA [Klebsiella pneumoniae]|uniref:Regulatory activator SdiA n=1 Tax=Klebsiella pneumoniae TaxID=573 RepID=A0A2X3FF35_KLEPN|nr:Regulatory activator SdiA [Klebsiella pneumoniae]
MLHQFQSMATGEEVYNLLQRETEALEYDYYTLCVRHPVAFHPPPRYVPVDLPPRMDVALSGRKLFRDRSCVTAGEFYAWPSAMERQPVS